MATAREMQTGDGGTAIEVLRPVLYNTFKHHAVALRHRVEEVVAGGEAALIDICAQLAVLGTRLMDMYTGPMTPREVSGWVIDELRLHIAPVNVGVQYERIFDGVPMTAWSSTSGRWTPEVTHVTYRR